MAGATVLRVPCHNRATKETGLQGIPGFGRFTIALKRVKPIIGLTGGIGAGKTMVAGLFESLGAAVIDSDRNAHRELAMPDVVATLRSWWGERVVTEDGTVDRSAIGDIVFCSPKQLQRLESFLYPRMAKRRAALIAEFMVDPAVLAVVLDSPKLFEAGLDRECDALVFVESDRRIRLRRVAKSRGWTEDEVARREKYQISLDKKRAKSDYTVVNNAGADALAPQIDNAFADILQRYSQ